MGDGLERARHHRRRCRAGSVMVLMMMLVTFMMMVSSPALSTARLMRELIIYENDVRYIFKTAKR
jgi:hypothetical protein